MEEPNPSAIYDGFCLKTSDLVKPIQNNDRNKDFYLGLLMQRIEKAFESTPSSSLQQNMCGLSRKMPNSSIIDEGNSCIDDLAVKAILIVATILENLEVIRKDCWELLEAIYKFAKSFHQLKDFPILNNLHKMKNVEADPLLSTIFSALRRCFFRKTLKEDDRFVLNRFNCKKDIGKHFSRVNEAHKDLGTLMLVFILRSEQRRPDEEDDVDIEDIKREKEVKDIIRRLNLKGEERSVAVILREQCKKNVGDVIYDHLKETLFADGFKFAKVNVTETHEFNPNIEELQAQILHELIGRNKYSGKKIHRMLRHTIEKEPTFIFIDNILTATDLRRILKLESMHPKKVRLLVTSPSSNVISTLENCGFFFVAPALDENNLEISSECPKDPLLGDMFRAYINRCKGANTESVCKWVLGKNLLKTGFRFAFENAFLNLPATVMDAFLDICCFFLGWDWDEVSSIVGDAELQTLETNAWVKRNRNNQISIQDSLLHWGRTRTKGARLTCREELENALSSDEEVTKIKGIWLLGREEKPVEIPAEKLELMSDTLRVLSLESSTIVKGKCNDSFQKLRFLQVGKCALPFHLNQLWNLRYFSSDEDVDFNTAEEEKYSIAEELKDFRSSKLDLRTLKLKHFPNLGKYKAKVFKPYNKLRKLSVNIWGEIELPESLCELYFLNMLDLHDCKHLQILPESFANLRCLTKLDLGYCQSLKRLPGTFGQLRSLEELILSYCLALEQLPDSFVWLGSLKKATFSHCYSLRKLPAKFEQMSSLQELDFSFCMNLKLLPTNFQLLSSLNILNLEGCSKLEKIPDSLPETLLKSECVAIKMCRCSNLTELSEVFCQDNKIEYLSLADCTNLKRLPNQIDQLKQVIKMNLSGCDNLFKLPNNFSELPCLEMLNLSSCEKLLALCKGFDRLTTLKDLNVSHCPNLNGKWMIKLEKMQSLRLVDIRGSDSLIDRWRHKKLLVLDKKRWCHFTVLTGQRKPTDQGMQEEEFRPIMGKTASNFFEDKADLIDLDGRPFFPSKNLAQGTTLAFIFDHNISLWDWEMLENNVDELLLNLIGMQIIYVGKSFSAIPTKLAEKLLAYTPENSQALSYFYKPLSITAGADFWHFGTYIIKTKVVGGNNGDMQFTEWESISGQLIGPSFKIEAHNNFISEMLACNDEPERTILESLEALTYKAKVTDSFAAEGGNQEKIRDFEGDMVFLLISTLEISKRQISFLKELYEEMLEVQSKRDSEIMWVWVPAVNADRDKWLPTYNEIVRSMPWETISVPWSEEQSCVTNVFRERLGVCEMPIIVAMVPGIGFYPEDLLPTVMTLGFKEFLFDEGFPSYDMEERKIAERRDLSSLSSLFLHFPDIGEKCGTSQMIWIYGGNHDMVCEFNQKIMNVSEKAGRDMAQIVYVGRRCLMGDHGREEEELYRKNTDGIPWLKLSFSEVKSFWHHTHYLISLLACRRQYEEENEKIVSLKRLLFGLLSLDCLSRRNGTVWMMAIDESGNNILTAKGKELVDLLSSNIEKSIKSSIIIRNEGVGVLSSKAELKKEPQIEVITQDRNKVIEAVKGQFTTFEDAPWLSVHPHSHLREHAMTTYGCDICYKGRTVYVCDTCNIFAMCQKCYNSEFVIGSKIERGEQIHMENC